MERLQLQFRLHRGVRGLQRRVCAHQFETAVHSHGRTRACQLWNDMWSLGGRPVSAPQAHTREQSGIRRVICCRAVFKTRKTVLTSGIGGQENAAKGSGSVTEKSLAYILLPSDI